MALRSTIKTVISWLYPKYRLKQALRYNNKILLVEPLLQPNYISKNNNNYHRNKMTQFLKTIWLIRRDKSNKIENWQPKSSSRLKQKLCQWKTRSQYCLLKSCNQRNKSNLWKKIRRKLHQKINASQRSYRIKLKINHNQKFLLLIRIQKLGRCRRYRPGIRESNLDRQVKLHLQKRILKRQNQNLINLERENKINNLLSDWYRAKTLPKTTQKGATANASTTWVPSPYKWSKYLVPPIIIIETKDRRKIKILNKVRSIVKVCLDSLKKTILQARIPLLRKLINKLTTELAL